MDNHTELSYCRYEGFKELAKNYLELEVIEEVEIMPADVAESRMPNLPTKAHNNVF